MASRKINLLPSELEKSKNLPKDVKLAQNLSYVTVFLFVAVVAVGIGYNYYLNNNLNNLVTEQDGLKQNISGLEETESRLILTKDRVQKIDQVLALRTAEDIYSRQKVISDNLPQTIQLEVLEIDSEKSVIELSSTNSRDLARFMATLLVIPDINTIVMDNIRFNSARGFTIVLEIT